MTAQPRDGGPMLQVEDLRVAFPTPHGPVRAVDGVSFQLNRGEVLAIVGESGSGKSACAMSLVGLTGAAHSAGTAHSAGAAHATVTGSARLNGRELIGMAPEELRAVRGAQVAMVFQDPMSCLNPVMRVGEQIAEQIRAHEPHTSHGAALERAGELMERLRIPAARERVRAYPHELSGGMRQRVMIAMALSCGPQVLLADEPTTALDVTIQAQILAQLNELREQEELGIVLITHDFAVVAQMADRVAVMRAGQIVEQGPLQEVLGAPAHPYTRGLLEALVPPSRRRPATPPSGDVVLEVRDLHVSFPSPQGGGAWGARYGLTARARGRAISHACTRALDGVSLAVGEGETLAIVGESGSGKTTLLRTVARLVQADGGSVHFAGHDITRGRGAGLALLRRAVRVVFQDPQASLNPRRRVGWTLQRALRMAGTARGERSAVAVRLLEQVGLSGAHAARFPHELSGGERQRVVIARALAARPRLVLLDEPVSSLDASIRRGVLELLARVQAELGCSYVLVSHDLSVVAGVADRIAVMHAGMVVEQGAAHQVLHQPSHPYTRELLAASPTLPGDRVLGGQPPH